MLTSPVIRVEGHNCVLRLYNYMYGKNVGSLNIYIRQEIDGVKELAFKRSGDQGQFWNRDVVPVGVANTFQFIIEGTVTQDQFVDIAIDDISVSSDCTVLLNETLPEGSTSVPETTVSPCSEADFKCLSDNSCISSFMVCDFTPDCPKGEDEANCGPCTFEDDYCGWSDSSMGEFHWNRLQAKDDAPYNHSSIDHTFLNSSGHYMILEPSYDIDGKTAILTSPALTHSVGEYCEIHMWVYTSLIQACNLLVYTHRKQVDDHFLIYNLSDHSIVENSWNEILIPSNLLPLESYFTIEATPNFESSTDWLSSSSTFSIDDINYFRCSTKTQGIDCNFDDSMYNEGFCMWEQDATTDQMNWINSKTETGGIDDHTTGKSYYIYVNSGDNNTAPTNAARLNSSVQSIVSGYNNIFSLWYYVYGESAGSFKIIYTSGGSTQTILDISGSQSDNWIPFEFSSFNNTDFYIILEAICIEDRLGIVAVDDIQLSNEVVSSVCDFEVDFCEWNQTNDTKLDWVRGFGRQNYSLFPDVDHTTNTGIGYFAYPNENKETTLAELFSPTYEYSGTQCLQFWYHLYGDHVGILTVAVKDHIAGTNYTTIWTTGENTYQMWHRGLSSIPDIPKMQLRIAVERGTEKRSVIAIDDVEFIPGPCPSEYFCDFERDLCSWYNEELEVDSFDWIIETGDTSGGPDVDHTIGGMSGHYILADLMDKMEGEHSAIHSGIVPSHLKCLHFFYSMLNIEAASLNIFIRQSTSELLKNLYKTSNEILWSETTIVIDNFDLPYEVFFEARLISNITNSEYHTIAIDDINFTENCQPTVTPTIPITPTSHYPSIYDCNFDGSPEFCSWTSNDLGQSWIIQHGSSQVPETGPATDHSTLTTYGQYIVVKTQNTVNRTARLISENIFIGDNGVCLSFWYNMNGFSVGRLSIFTIDEINGYSSPKWVRSNYQAREWIRGYISLKGQNVERAVFEATTQESGYGDIALDDIQIDMNECAKADVCTFEIDMCGYESTTITENAKWEILETIEIPEYAAQPTADHTYQAAGGKFVGARSLGLAQLSSPLYDSSVKCVEFWLYSFGMDSESEHSIFSVGSGDTDIEINHNLGTGWVRYIVDSITDDDEFSIWFGAKILEEGYIIGLDDIKPHSSCEETNRCEFETGTCTWTNVQYDDFDWAYITADVLQNSYGPTVDETYGSPYGIFSYVDTFFNKMSHDKYIAVFQSPLMNYDSVCLTFWYHLNGRTNPKLEILANYGETNDGTVHWNTDVVVNADWKFERIYIVPNDMDEDGYYHIKFVATTEDGEEGIIAIDSIFLEHGECSSNVTSCILTCDGSKCIDEDQMCDFVADCTSGADENNCGYNCTFEGGNLCKWNNQYNQTDLSWLILQGETSNSDGPAEDHSTFTGQGFYISAIPGDLNVEKDIPIALLYSPLLRNSAATCRVHFWMYIYGPSDNEIGTISLYVKDEDETLIYSVSGSENNEWTESIAYIGRNSESFTILIKAERNLDYSGYIALDDIYMEDCFMPSASNGSCSESEYKCNNEACVSREVVCDYVDNCGDYSDEIYSCEKYYARCNFESGNICLWEEQGDTTWEVGSPDTSNIYPKRDHTLNKIEGSYMHLSSNDENQIPRTASIISGVVKWDSALEEYCRFRLFYFIYGPDASNFTINVQYHSDGSLINLFTVTGSNGQLWEQVEILLDTSENPDKLVRFIISGAVNNYSGDLPSVVAVDDISFSLGCSNVNDTLPVTLSTTSSTTTFACGSDDFYCDDNECISADSVCNFIEECSDGSDESMCAQCDFEENMCGWTDESLGDYFWYRQYPTVVGRNETVMEVLKRIGGQTHECIMTSVSLGPADPTCVVAFYYYKHNLDILPKTITKLSMIIKSNDGDPVIMWSIEEDIGDIWKHVMVNIGEHSSGWIMRFEAVVETNEIVIIDNVLFSNCSFAEPTICDPKEFKCMNGVCISMQMMCDFSDDCGDWSDEEETICYQYQSRCNFENDFCRWYNEEENTINWISKSGDTISSDLGPDFDHTYGNETGMFAYLESVQGTDHKTGSLLSTNFKTPPDACRLRFWYIMRANTSSALVVKIKDSPLMFTERLVTTIFESEGTTDYGWQRVDVKVTFSRDFQVYIEGQTGIVEYGDIAIDDISFSSECDPVTIETTIKPIICNTDQFQCNSQQCIPRNEVCDFTNDCSDDSDEADCPRYCDYESEKDSLCKWNNFGDSSNMNWVRGMANSDSMQITGPHVDHDYIIDGHFLYLKADNSTDSDEATIFSHFFQNSNSHCEIRYFYYRNGTFPSKIFLRLNSTSSNLFNLIEFSQNAVYEPEGEWNEDIIGLGRQKFAFQLSFIASGKKDNDFAFAVDTMSFVGCGFDNPSENSCQENEYHCPQTMVSSNSS